MLILRSSPASPFVRKIRIAASVLGLDREITIELRDNDLRHAKVNLDEVVNGDLRRVRSG